METPAEYFARTKLRQQRALKALGHSNVTPDASAMASPAASSDAAP